MESSLDLNFSDENVSVHIVPNLTHKEDGSNKSEANDEEAAINEELSDLMLISQLTSNKRNRTSCKAKAAAAAAASKATGSIHDEQEKDKTTETQQKKAKVSLTKDFQDTEEK